MATWNTSNKSNSTWIKQVKAGQGWLYDQANINYDSITDNISQDAVLYDSIGTLPSWTKTNKSNSSWSNQARH